MNTFKAQYTEADVILVPGLGFALPVHHLLGKNWTHVACWVQQPSGLWQEYSALGPLAVYQVDDNLLYISSGLVYTSSGGPPFSPFVAEVRVSA